MARQRGFTLIELMVVVLVIAVLASIALSGYQKQVRKSRRAEARQYISDFSLREEKFRANNANYGTCADLFAPLASCAAFNSSTAGGKYYTLDITFPSSGTCTGGQAKGNANSYIITAAPRSGSDQAKDAACASLVWTNDCGTVSKTSSAGGADCW